MMTVDEDRPSTQEIYQRATQSSNLRPTRCGVRGDLDVLAAAAMAQDSLGMLLFRLVGEYDACRGEKALYEAEAARLYEAQRQVAKVLGGQKRSGADDLSLWEAKAEHKRLGEEAKREVLTGRAMVLIRLKSLSQVRQELWGYSAKFAEMQALDVGLRDLLNLTGRVLDAFLDPNCPPCDGRGFNGGTHRGERQMICRACRGSGHRRDDVGHTPAEREIAGRMFTELSRKMAEAEKHLRAALRDGA